MDDIYLFLAHAVRLETDSARRFEELAEIMATAGNREVRDLFARMARNSRTHLGEAKRRSGSRPLPALAPDQYQWPDGTSPETAGWAGVDGLTGVEDALKLVLAGERAGHAFYASVVSTTTNPRVRAAAEEFAVEEAGHIAELEHWLKRHAAAGDRLGSPPASVGNQSR